MPVRSGLLLAALLVLATPGAAEDDPVAKEAFGAARKPAALPAQVIGFYAKGCLAGGAGLPATGPNWQVMRPSRNRAWGHPVLVKFLEDFAKSLPRVNGWPGLLVGDIAQPRGGPMLTGHASHQIGLDADVWLTPMPERVLTPEERENMEPVNLVAADWNDVDHAKWTPAHAAIIRAAATRPGVERLFVNPAIKKALCRETTGDRSWLHRVRPMYGHNYHMHIRLACPAGEAACQHQAPPPSDDGCGKELDWWFSYEARHPKPVKPAPPMRLSALPAACRAVLAAP
jgi:penicillin-insensitive murein endopeptidase